MTPDLVASPERSRTNACPLILDGAMGTGLQALDLPLSAFDGHEGCPEILNLTRPAAVRSIHDSFLSVGCDAVETNTFGANTIVLGEFGLADRAYELSRRGAELARECADSFATPDHPRYVFGSLGPGTKLPSLGQITYSELVKAYTPQVEGLLDGGVDWLLIETCQDLLQAKAVLGAVQDVFATRGMDLGPSKISTTSHNNGNTSNDQSNGGPAQRSERVRVALSVTMEPTGAMLIGSDISAALTSLSPFAFVDVIGLNCATGPDQMYEHLRYLADHSPRPISVLPNAGLPENVGGQPHYPLTPDELARHLATFVHDYSVSIVGGCCGTTPDHLAAVVRTLRPKNS